MTTDEVKAQLLWMLANRPGYYMWVGWLRSLPVEYQEWVRAQWPLIRTVVGIHMLNIKFWQVGEEFRNLMEAIGNALRPALQSMVESIAAFQWEGVHRVYANGLQTTRPKFRVVEREV